MAIYVEQLKDRVLDNVHKSDDVYIVSGYFSTDILEEIANTGINIFFYYGMYDSDGITPIQLNSLKKIEKTYPNFKANIVYDYHIHTKCYIFKKAGLINNVLVGSANVSRNGLSSGKNSELLVDVTDRALYPQFEVYLSEVISASVHYDDALIVPTIRCSPSSKRILTPHGRVFSGNPLVDNIPLYNYNNRKKKIVLEKSGLNWGLQKGNTSKVSPFAEAYIPIDAFDIDKYPLIIPPLGKIGSGTGGKSTRRLGPVTVTWDDGTIMSMLFQGKGPQRPTPSKQIPGVPYNQYPKQLTTNEGGVVLGEYLRKRLKVGGRALITYADLKRYGRDYITLTCLSAGNYEADFKV